ncbi:MAG TPA: DNA-processing protein DprA [Candidatus Dormibacteraeota bacterium]|nr:DNA-processing protein DprA [Candidatus Dormibacteraeota bacterium]
MDVFDYVSDEGQVVLALCSAFALPENLSERDAAPFTLSEWNELEKSLESSSLKTPSELRSQSAEGLSKELRITGDEAERIVRLLARSGRLALELERLFSRGLWVVTRRDERYPTRLRQTLKHQAPVVIFGAGDIRLLGKPGVAVVGSRNIDEAGTRFARAVGEKAVQARMAVVSGGARGTDRIAMDGALSAEGIAMGALADSLEATVRKPDVRQYLEDDRLVLITPYAPNAGFSVGGAMGRNKVIYGLSEFAVVVSSDFQTGGTWAGAMEALKGKWCSVFVRNSENSPKGNAELIKKGAVALPENALNEIEDLAEWMREHSQPEPTEQDLFKL